MERGGAERQADKEGRKSGYASQREARRARQAERHSVATAEREKYGGVKVGSAFFGWLTATGTAVLLTALVAASGTAVAVATNTNVGNATTQAAQNPKTVGLVGGAALLAIIFVAYFCGGYVAGRMARFNGVTQGFAVWLWAVVIAVFLAIVGAAGGSKYNVLGQLNSFPRIPVDEGTLSSAGIVALITIALASLVGAVLGGLAGMRFHRKVDRVGEDPGTAKGTARGTEKGTAMDEPSS
jgi:hypothetical protein